MRTAYFSLLLISITLFALPITNQANQADQLRKFIKSTRSSWFHRSNSWAELDSDEVITPGGVIHQDGSMEADRIEALPGQPKDVNFNQYGGYVTVDEKRGKALFYYFVESAYNSSTKPLVLWLNGGPGCSSLGYGAMQELGPFRINSDRKTLHKNKHAWSNVANMLFLESPAGVGFSYSNTTSDYSKSGDRQTARDAYTFLVNWLERFPQYKDRDFYITGESYSGHYVPELAATILHDNMIRNRTVINLKGIAVGNAFVDGPSNDKATFEFLWNHAIISDEAYGEILRECNFSANITKKCSDVLDTIDVGQIDLYNIYAPVCFQYLNGSVGSNSQIAGYDPCSDFYVTDYLNDPTVQKAFHAKPTNWQTCSDQIDWIDEPVTTLPIIKQLIASGLRVWLYSGDVDDVVPITATRYAVHDLGLSIRHPWHPWHYQFEVGGYVVEYDGLTLVTVRDAGHMVPSYQPARSLIMFYSFLRGNLPPTY
ncbi:serine carboxypeptidase 1-like [Typha latifolia]|uniref:serine carboxypeptidase 1-like n=1 Tax=Typha latifolia TaxID=4733 RepID=UPI003C2DBD51